MSFTDWFWEVSSPNSLFYSLEERKEISCCLCVLVICCLTSNAHHAGYVLSMTRLLKTIFGLAGYRRYKAATNVLLNALLDPVRDPAKCFKFFSDKHCMQVATSSTFPSANDVIELCCILYNKTSIIATSFSQRTTAFEIFFNRTYLHFRYLVLEKQKLKISASLPDLFDS